MIDIGENTSENKKEIIIKNVEKNKKGYEVTLNTGEKYLFYEDEVVNYRLLKDNGFTKAEWNKIKKFQQIALYYQKAIHFIDYKPRSKKEIFDYLKKLELSVEDAQIIIHKLETIHYLDDDRYAKMLLDESIRHKLGEKKIKEAMVKKGIDKKIIEKYFSTLDPNNFLDNGIEVAQKYLRTKTNKTSLEQKKGVYQTLLRNGYRDSQIQIILSKLEFVNNDDELLETRIQKYQQKITDKTKLTQKLLREGFSYSSIRDKLK